MLLETAETVLGYFGFDSNVYGDHINKNKRWWSPSVEERQRDTTLREFEVDYLSILFQNQITFDF